MKRCPECRRDYYDDTLLYCLDDGNALLEGPASASSGDEPATAILHSTTAPGEAQTETLQGEVVTEFLNSNSIAVLPFVNISSDVDNEYFCDGLAEDLLNALSKIADLKVAARTSAFSFKGKNANIREIASALGVRTILEGSVRKEAEHVRISVQLINAQDGYQIWTESYDREMKSIFDVQDEITLAIADALRPKFFHEERDAILKRHTDNTEAYDYYLKGRYQYQKYTPEGWLTAIDLFEHAIECEAAYASAYANLASVLAYCWYFDVLPPAETAVRWLTATERALELNDNLDEAHGSLARYRFYYARDWSAAEASFVRALELNKKNAEIQHQYGMLLAVMGRIDEALERVIRALELDPLSPMNRLQAGWVHLFSGRLDEVERIASNLIEIEPDFFGAHWQLGIVHWAKGQLKESLECFQNAIALTPSPTVVSHIGAIYADLGELEKAAEIADQLIEIRGQRAVAAYNIVRVYSRIGDHDKACDWLEASLADNDGELVFLNVEIKPNEPGTFGMAIRENARFRDILKRVGLPE
jgi:serine/threonine-protein kinase